MGWAEGHRGTTGGAERPLGRVPRVPTHGSGCFLEMSMESNFQQMVGRAPKMRGKKHKVYEKGRECDLMDYEQELTRFNPGPFCYLHSRKSFRRVRGASRRDTAV
jgi:hypothetical protein